jgi:hypothetical protein
MDLVGRVMSCLRIRRSNLPLELFTYSVLIILTLSSSVENHLVGAGPNACTSSARIESLAVSGAEQKGHFGHPFAHISLLADDLRTVIAAKGSLRRGQHRGALDRRAFPEQPF